MIALAAAAAALLALGLTLVRLFGGPTLYDRTLAANLMVMNVALLCACLASAAGHTVAIDIALALLFGSFVINVAVLKFFRARNFQAPLAQTREGL
jgi:multicomponent Na+:H+ antiporter subunit F